MKTVSNALAKTNDYGRLRIGPTLTDDKCHRSYVLLRHQVHLPPPLLRRPWRETAGFAVTVDSEAWLVVPQLCRHERWVLQDQVEL